MSNEIGEFIKNIPPVTRFLFLGTFGLTVLANLTPIIPFQYLLLTPRAIWNFEIWRFITCFLFGGQLGFHFLMRLYFLYNYSKNLESQFFEGRRADYVFFILFSCVCLLIIGSIFTFYLLGEGLTFAIVYLWSQLNREVIVSFMFGARFKAIYLPWVLLAFNILMGGKGVFELVGIVVGHLYYFLTELYPRSSGVQLLKTPQFLINFFPPEGPRVHGFSANGPINLNANDANQNRGHTWGRGGNRLGEN